MATWVCARCKKNCTGAQFQIWWSSAGEGYTFATGGLCGSCALAHMLETTQPPGQLSPEEIKQVRELLGNRQNLCEHRWKDTFCGSKESR